MSRRILLDSRIKKYAYSNIDEIYRSFEVSNDGLSDEQVEYMRNKYGENTFDEKKTDTMSKRLRRAFINPFNIILFVLGIVSFVTDVFFASNFSKNATTCIIIFSMIFIGSTIRLIQELRANNAAKQLQRLINESVTVRRNGKAVNIPANELVVGDTIILSAGERVPADIRLTKVNDLFISQASITGESAVLEKNCHTLKHGDDKALTYLGNLAFMTTSIISGKGEGVVLATGKDTLYGSFTVPEADHKNSFEKGANSIAWVMLKFIAILIPIVFVLLGITGGKWFESFAFALSVAVGLMPEMLPMVITACLAKGSLTMSKKQTLIKNINAMQSFGSMDVLCMDKTGTLTNESILLEYYMDILGNESCDVLDKAYINSTYHSGVRNPVDNAIISCKTMPNKASHFDRLLESYKKLDEIPFDYNRKLVSVLVERDNCKNIITKGDIEQVLSRCKYIMYKDEILPMNDNPMESASTVVDEMLKDGMKVVAVAVKDIDSKKNITVDDENNMVLIGYLAFFDAPKSTAKSSIEALKKLKVVPKILTGDQADVAVSICHRVGIETKNIITGEEIDCMTDAELSNAVENIHIFAQLTPGQKVRIVSALRDNGHTVGFLGDGINDIPALNEANVGISVDTAVDAAKDSADVVLLQKDLGVLEQGVLEGRKTFTNMLKYVKITASSNFGNILAIVCASAFLPFLPMASIQLLLLNLLYDALCIVMPFDNVDHEALYHPRDWSGKSLGKFMMCFGPISSLFDIITFVFLYFVLCPLLCGGLTFQSIADPTVQAKYISLFQTGWFLESLWTQVLILYFLRTNKLPFIQSKPSIPLVLTTLVGIVTFTILTFTSGASLFGMTNMPVWYLGFLLLIAVSYMLLTTVIKSIYQKKNRNLL